MVVTIGLVVALILAIVGLIVVRGRSWIAWSAAVGFAVLLYARLA